MHDRDPRERVLGVFLHEALDGAAPPADATDRIRHLLDGDVRPTTRPAPRRDRFGPRPSATPGTRRLPVVKIAVGAAAAVLVVAVVVAVMLAPVSPPDGVRVGPDADWRLAASDRLELRSGWLLITPDSPPVHAGDSVAVVRSGRSILVAVADAPVTDAARTAIVHHLETTSALTPPLTPDEKDRIMNPAKWLTRGGFAALVLAGTLLIDGQAIHAQDNDPAPQESGAWYAPQLDPGYLDEDADHYAIPRDALVVGLRSDGFVWFGAAADRVESLGEGTKIDTDALQTQLAANGGDADERGIRGKALVFLLEDARVPVSRLVDALMVAVSPDVMMPKLSVAARVPGRDKWIAVPFHLPVDQGLRQPGMERPKTIRVALADLGPQLALRVIDGDETVQATLGVRPNAAKAFAATRNGLLARVSGSDSLVVQLHLWPRTAPAELVVGMRAAVQEAAPDAEVQYVPTEAAATDGDIEEEPDVVPDDGPGVIEEPDDPIDDDNE